MVDEIGRSLKLLPREFGSRRVTSDQLRELFEDLKTIVPRFERFKVWRFGHQDVLEYPIDRLPEAIDRYDVQRIYGRGYLPHEEHIGAFIEIDLWAGGNTSNWDWLFELDGPKSKVDMVVTLLKEHIDRWQPTWHKWFHFSEVNWIVLGMLSVASAYALSTFPESPNLANGFKVGIILYMLGFVALVLAKAGNWTPFIWFYRPGSPIEARRLWFPRLSIFALLAVIPGVIANWAWSYFVN